MLKYFLPVIMFVLMVTSIAGGLLWYWSLPVVAIDSNGQCAWVQYSRDREPCPEQLPRKYVDVRVQ